MTSPLRRKRQITVRSMRPAKGSNRSIKKGFVSEETQHDRIGDFCNIWKFCGWTICIAAGLIIFSIAGKVAAANDNTGQIKYTTGKMGGRLKWTSPEAGTRQTVAASAVKPVQYAEPRQLDTAQPQILKPPAGTLNDPFDDGRTQRILPQIPGSVPKENSQAKSAEPALSNLDAQKTESPYIPPKGLAPLRNNENTADLPQPHLEREIEPRHHEFNEKCPSPKDLKPISELTTNIAPSEGDLPHDCPLGDTTFEGRAFSPVTYTWTASALCHKPLYFEDVQLERYGHMAGPWIQPFASAVNFFATFPILPYKMGLEPPNECLYTLGYYRPGNCAPYMFDPLPLSVRAGLFEAGAWVAAPFLIP